MHSRARRRRNLTLTVIAVIAGALLFFLGFFYVTDIEVVGNTRYSAEEIQELCVTNVLQRNSVLFSLFWRDMDMSDVPFMNSVSAEFIDRNTIRLHVNEKTPIGYIRDGDTDYFFDQDGLVLETMEAGTETSAAEETAEETAEENPEDTGETAEDPGNSGETAEDPDSAAEEAASENGIPQEGAIVEGGSSTEAETPSETDAAQVGEERAEDTQETGAESYGSTAENVDFNPALTDVPMITGITEKTPALDQKIEIRDESLLNTIQALTKLIDRYGITPEYVEFDEENNMTLHYGSIRIALGTDSNLEEKMSRVNAILPKLEGESGILHLEDFSEETQNIIFDRDQ